MAAELLEAGQPLRLADGTSAHVISVRNTGEMESVYNFEVEGFHTYHIGELGVWVHNDNCAGRLDGSFEGMTTKYVLKNIPNGWKKVKANATGKNKGWILRDSNGVDRIRYMRPQKGFHVFGRKNNGYWRRQNSDGNYLDVQGSLVDPSLYTTNRDLFQRLTHIPYSGVK